MKLTRAIALTAITFILHSCGPMSRPLSTYETTVKTDSPVVDLSHLLNRCKRALRDETPGGFIEIRYPRDLDLSVAQKIAGDAREFYPVAMDVLGEGGRSDLILYVLPLKRKPMSWTISTERRGEIWRLRYIGFLLLTDDSPLDSEGYWSQLGSEIHEMAHTYIDLSLSGCHRDTPVVRWFEDGVATLFTAVYLRGNAPASFAEWESRHATPADESAFDASILEWRKPDLEDLDFANALPEADRYAVAYRVVRFIYDRDGGASLKRLKDALHQASPRTRRELDSVLLDILGLDGERLVDAARAHMIAGREPR